MATDEIDYQQIIEDLTDEDLTESAFDLRWVEFVCETLPRLDQDALLGLVVDLEDAVGFSSFSADHHQIIRSVYDKCFGAYGEEVDGADRFRVGIALAETCALRPSQVEQRVFENIPDVESARELFGYMALTANSNFFSYLTYLNAQGVINVQEWNTRERWPEQLALTPGRVGNVPVRIKPKESEYQISDAAQARFPFLQDAINVNAVDPAFPTVWPIINKLASQVAREGGLTRHVALLGPPGVGKTESARILHRLLESMNACGTKFETFSPGKDTEYHVDEMANRMKVLLNGMKAKGGLILVDEAGKFADGRSSNDPGAFRKRTLDVVFEQAEKLLDQGVVVVFAGYRDAFEKVLEQDAGFARRILMVDIEPPSVTLLANSVWKSLVSDGITVPPNFEENTKWLFEQMIEDSSMNFGYWATAKNFESALLDSATGDFLTTGSDMAEEISVDDFENAARDIGYVSSRIKGLDFSGHIPRIFDGEADIEGELRTFFDPPGDAPGRVIE